MPKSRLLTKEKIKSKYPDQWLLLEDIELDSSTTLRKARVLAHSKDREEIHRALKKHRGNLGIHFTGGVPKDTVVIFPRLAQPMISPVRRLLSTNRRLTKSADKEVSRRVTLR